MNKLEREKEMKQMEKILNLCHQHLTRKLPLILGHEVAVGLHGDDVTGVMPLVRPHDSVG